MRRRTPRAPIEHYGDLIRYGPDVELPEQDLLLPDYSDDREPSEWVDGFRARMAEIEGRRSA